MSHIKYIRSLVTLPDSKPMRLRTTGETLVVISRRIVKDGSNAEPVDGVILSDGSTPYAMRSGSDTVKLLVDALRPHLPKPNQMESIMVNAQDRERNGLIVKMEKMGRALKLLNFDEAGKTMLQGAKWLRGDK